MGRRPGTHDDGMVRSEYDDGVDRAAYVRYPPHPLLRPFVRGSYAGYVEQTGSFTRRVEPATAAIPFIVNLGAPLGVGLGPGGVMVDYSDGFVGGMQESFAVVDSGGAQTGIQVSLTSLGVRRLIGISMREIRGRLLSLREAFGPPAELLREEVRSAPDWPSRLAIIDAFLLSRIAVADAPAPPTLQHALARIQASEGAVDISSLTTEIGCSRRYLISVFNDYVGIPPKLYARTLRFQHARRLGETGGLDWGQVAAVCGYYDQSHLIRDFHRFAGHSPGEHVGRLLAVGGVRAD